MTGYFRLKRGIFEHPLFQNAEKFTRREAWIWLIEQANYSESKFRQGNEVYTIPRGSLASSYRAIARIWRWSADRVIRELKVWEKEGMVELETRHGYLHVTLCKYGFYQASLNTDATVPRQEQDIDGTRTSTNQIKETKGKKGNNNSPPAYTPEFEQFWKTYPRNNGEKFEALQSYLKARKDTDHGRIIEGAGAYRNYCESQGTERRYVKHASTWLNLRGWDTERDSSQSLPGHRASGPAPSHADPATTARDIGEAIIERRRLERERGAAESQPQSPGRADSAVVPDLFQPKNLRG